MLEELQAKLSLAELKARRAALKKARGFIQTAPRCGIAARLRKSYRERSEGRDTTVRVDIEVLKGVAFLPDRNDDSADQESR
jgi:hypothetical protein